MGTDANWCVDDGRVGHLGIRSCQLIGYLLSFIDVLHLQALLFDNPFGVRGLVDVSQSFEKGGSFQV